MYRAVTSCDNFDIAMSLLEHQPFELVVAEVRQLQLNAGVSVLTYLAPQAACDIDKGWSMLNATSYAPLAGTGVLRSTSPLRLRRGDRACRPRLVE